MKIKRCVFCNGILLFRKKFCRKCGKKSLLELGVSVAPIDEDEFRELSLLQDPICAKHHG